MAYQKGDVVLIPFPSTLAHFPREKGPQLLMNGKCVRSKNCYGLFWYPRRTHVTKSKYIFHGKTFVLRQTNFFFKPGECDGS